MSDSYGTLYQGWIPSSVGELFTAPTGTGTITKHYIAINEGSVTATFRLFRNGTAAPYGMTPLCSLDPGQSAEGDFTMALEESGYIAGVASVANTISILIDGDETS